MHDPYEDTSETWVPNLFVNESEQDDGYEASDSADTGYEAEWPTYNGEDY